MRVVPLQQGHNSPGYHIADGRTGALRMLAQTRGNILGQLDRDRYDRGRDANRALDRLGFLQGKTVLAGLTEQFSDVGARVFGHAQVIEDKPTVAGEALDGRSDAVSCL
jgi:hypothetical protein